MGGPQSHYPVMLEESIEWLRIRPAGLYADCTAGLGGHTSAIAQRLAAGKLLSVDWDEESLAMCRENTAAWADRIIYWRGKFSNLEAAIQSLGEANDRLSNPEGQTQGQQKPARLDGLLADLGVSRYQLTSPERGFSFQADGPLDMRADRSQELTAADIVNFSSEQELANLIYELGEERRSRRAARAIVAARPIRSTGHLAQVVEKVLPRTGKLHPATQVFLALRLAVSGELDELDALLEQLPRVMAPGGRVVMITFMSTEDRKVKRAFQALARGGVASILTKHVVVPGEQEVRENAASRSAKLRVAEFVEATEGKAGRKPWERGQRIG
jgi:16S rRNA (cytosine1402-N4)-methyltransferase